MIVSMGNVAASGGYYISGGCPFHFNTDQRRLRCWTYPAIYLSCWDRVHIARRCAL